MKLRGSVDEILSRYEIIITINKDLGLPEITVTHDEQVLMIFEVNDALRKLGLTMPGEIPRIYFVGQNLNNTSDVNNIDLVGELFFVPKEAGAQKIPYTLPIPAKYAPESKKVELPRTGIRQQINVC